MKYCQMFNHTKENDLSSIPALRCRRRATWVWHSIEGLRYVCDKHKDELTQYSYITEDLFTTSV